MTKKQLNAFFIGNVQSSKHALATLLELPQVNMIGVLTQRQSCFNSDFSDISGIATNAGVPVYFIEDIEIAPLAHLIRNADVDMLYEVFHDLWCRLAIFPKLAAEIKIT